MDGLRRVGRRLRAFLASLRLRLVWWFVVVLAVTTIASILVVRQVLVQGLDARIDGELAQEAQEISQLAEGNDPETGAPFGGRVDRIFEVFMARNVPNRYETLQAYVGGRLFLEARGSNAPPLGPTTARFAGLAESERGRLSTAEGDVEYLAVPFRVDGEPVGVFVVAVHRDLQRAEADAAALSATFVGLIMLVVGSLLAARLADRILAPVRAVARTAQSISESDLSRRIDVQGHDEISELAATFNDMLERLDASFATQRRFIDDAGHELRTPITIIRGHLDLLSDRPAEREHTLRLLDDELERVRRMIDDLLTLARSERPDFLRPQNVDLGDLTGLVLDKARGLGDRAWTDDGHAVAWTWVDEQRLTQALLQLAENAVRHTKPGDVIAVGSSSEGQEARVWVRDTGVGIDPAEESRIFERFFRGRTGRRRAEGSGLGLSIVQAIAEAHGGRVELRSFPGAGSTFTIVVPISPERPA